MKKTLKELELIIPSINLLETRSIIGGYDIEPVEIYPDFGDEENSERDDDQSMGPDPNEQYESEQDEDREHENNSEPDQDSENAQNDPTNITFNNVSPADQAIIEKTMSALPAILQGLPVTIQIGATKDSAAAQYSNGVITLSASDVPSSALFHEMVHALQDNKLAQEGKDMTDESRSALEYQTFVLQNLYDIVSMDGAYNPACFSNEYSVFMSECFPDNIYTYENFNYEYFIEHINEFYSEFVNANAGASSGYGDDYNPDYDFDWENWLNDLFNLGK